jgi:exosortase F-associated protein
MRQNPNAMNKYRVFGMVLCFLLFAIYRHYEGFFYDPIVGFFSSSNSSLGNLSFDFSFYTLSLISRYLINTGLTILTIHLWFRSKKYTTYTLDALLVVGVLVIPMFLIQVYFDFPFGKMFAFYLRRIIVYPIVLLLLLAVFYFDSQKNV